MHYKKKKTIIQRLSIAFHSKGILVNMKVFWNPAHPVSSSAVAGEKGDKIPYVTFTADREK